MALLFKEFLHEIQNDSVVINYQDLFSHVYLPYRISDLDFTNW